MMAGIFRRAGGFKWQLVMTGNFFNNLITYIHHFLTHEGWVGCQEKVHRVKGVAGWAGARQVSMITAGQVRSLR